MSRLEEKKELAADLEKFITPEIEGVDEAVAFWMRTKLRCMVDGLDGLAEWAKRIQSGVDLVISRINLEKTHEFQLLKITSSGTRRKGLISEFDVLLFYGEGEEQEIYYVGFCDTDYPDLGINRGFTVGRHFKPEEYSSFLDIGIPEMWKKIGVGDQDFPILVGVALCGIMERLTENEENGLKDVKRCLGFFSEQNTESAKK